MFKATRKAVLASTAVAMGLCQFSAPAFADVWVNPSWPTVQCKKDGKRFHYNPNGAPNYASAAQKCSWHGGVDSGPTITRGKAVVVKERAKAAQQIPQPPGCGSPSGVQNQSTC